MITLRSFDSIGAVPSGILSAYAPSFVSSADRRNGLNATLFGAENSEFLMRLSLHSAENV